MEKSTVYFTDFRCPVGTSQLDKLRKLATAGKFDLAKRAKAADLDAIHDTVHEMAKDEARHGKAFAGLLKRYFGE